MIDTTTMTLLSFSAAMGFTIFILWVCKLPPFDNNMLGRVDDE